jgi:hypothetical protein
VPVSSDVPYPTSRPRGRTKQPWTSAGLCSSKEMSKNKSRPFQRSDDLKTAFFFVSPFRPARHSIVLPIVRLSIDWSLQAIMRHCREGELNRTFPLLLQPLSPAAARIDSLKPRLCLKSDFPGMILICITIPPPPILYSCPFDAPCLHPRSVLYSGRALTSMPFCFSRQLLAGTFPHSPRSPMSQSANVSPAQAKSSSGMRRQFCISALALGSL